MRHGETRRESIGGGEWLTSYLLQLSRSYRSSAPPYKCTAGREGLTEGRRLLYARDQRDGGWSTNS